MGFRIHRGIFQKLNAERTAYENTFKIGDDGRIKEVDSEGNVTAGYLKVGEQASDANTVDGLHASSFIRSDADDNVSGHTEWQDNKNVRLGNGADFRMWHDGTNTYFKNYHHASGNMYWQGESTEGNNRALLYLRCDTTRPYVQLFENGSEKLRTVSTGIYVYGDATFDDWVRVKGSDGLYFQDYGGGWRMTDTSWIRAYNDKHIYTGGNIEVGGTIRANGNGFYVDSTNVINSAGKFVGNVDNSETRSDYFIQEAHGNPRSNLGSPTVTEMALFDSQFRCMTDLSNNYTNLDRLTFWVQQNEGEAWAEVTHSDTNKKRFLRTNNSGVVIPNRAYKFRVEFKAPGYVYANALYFYWSSNSHSTKVHVYKYNASQDTWHAHATSNNNVSSWPGHLYLPFSTIPWHETHTTSTGHHRYIRVEFIPNWSTGSYADRTINLYGGQIWGGYPSGRRTVHSINEDGNYYFPANLYAEGGSGDGNRLATRSWVGSNYQASGNYFTDGDTVLNMANNDGLVYNDTNNLMYIKADGTNHAIIDSRGGTVSGTMTFTGEVQVREGSPTISLIDTDSDADDFYIHVNSHNFYVLRDVAGANNVGSGWDGPHPLQLEGDTNTAYVFGNQLNISNWDTAYGWGNHASAGYLTSLPSHNHNKITENATISFGQGSLQWTDLNGNGGDGLNGNTPGNPFNDWHHHIIMNHSNSSGYYVDVAYSFHHDRVHFRRKAGSDPQSWREFWHTGNLSTTKVSNWDTAYGWGDHSTQGYLDTVPEEYKTQTQNDARYAAIAHDHSGVYDPAGTAQSVSDDLEPRIAAVETTASRNETNIAAKANLGGSYGQDFKADDMRVDQWFRNTVSGKGLYNEATTQHFYSDSDDYWNVAGGSSANGIRFRDEHGGTVRGYVYATNNNEVGFLDAGASWAIRHTNDWGTRFYTDGSTEEFRVGRDAVTGNYGTVETKTTRSSWGGYSINGRVVFMHDHGNWWGIYNDVNNEWMIRGELNGRVELRHNSATKLETTSTGVTVTGTMTATAFAGDGSALTGISAGAPPVVTTVEGGEESTLASIHFNPGEGVATFTLGDGSTYRLAFAR